MEDCWYWVSRPMRKIKVFSAGSYTDRFYPNGSRYCASSPFCCISFCILRRLHHFSSIITRFTYFPAPFLAPFLALHDNIVVVFSQDEKEFFAVLLKNSSNKTKWKWQLLTSNWLKNEGINSDKGIAEKGNIKCRLVAQHMSFNFTVNLCDSVFQ